MNAIRRISLSLAAIATAAGTTATAQAATATPRPLAQATLATCKQVGNTEATRRVAMLDTLRQRVESAKDLTGQHRSALLTLIGNDSSGLTALDQTIQADPTVTQCRSDVQLIVTRYRVYVLVVPQVHLAIAADVLASVDTTFARLETPLSQRIAHAKLSDDQRARAQAALADFDSIVAAAGTEVTGQADTVLALTPAGYPGTTTTLKSVRATLKQARAHLGTARSDFDTIADILGLH